MRHRAVHVGAQRLAHHVVDVVGVVGPRGAEGREVLEAEQHRGVVADLVLAVDLDGEALQGLQVVLGPRLGLHLVDGLGPLLAVDLPGQHAQVVAGEVGVPDVEGALAREGQHGLAVGRHRQRGGRPAGGLVEAPVLAGDEDAGGEALDVPLPGAGQGLVEVVHVEHELALGGRVAAEVRQVGVAADLGGDAADGRGGEVGGHHPCRAAVEGERRDRHAAVTHGGEERHAVGVLLAQQGDRVAPVGRRRPGRVLRPGHVLAGGPPHRLALRHRDR
jgi:hypothetical protein